jgi:hypothetical protein
MAKARPTAAAARRALGRASVWAVALGAAAPASVMVTACGGDDDVIAPPDASDASDDAGAEAGKPGQRAEAGASDGAVPVRSSGDGG